MKTINRYQVVVLTSSGTATRETRAGNRTDASNQLRCPIHEVEYLETIPMNLSERKAEHAARVPIHSWRLESIVDKSAPLFRPRRKKSKERF